MAYTTINKPSDYFNTLTYTGDGSSSRNITGVGFQPDLLWIKNRDAAQYHFVFDAVRGVSKAIFPNATDAESTQIPCMSAFLSDGFTVGSDAASNGNGNGIVAWNWLANGAGSANTDGSISSTVSANTTSGFSIVSWTGTGSAATIGHGLGVAPKWIIVKSRGVENWRVYSSYLGATKAMRLNGTDAADTDSSYWNGEPTSSVFTVGTNAGTNGSSVNMIAYCFAEKQGFSKFGSYTGNGSTDGTFIYTGFKPAFVIAKMSSGADDWRMITQNVNSRNTISNEIDKNLYAHATNAETATNIDFVSNGMKIRSSSGGINSSGQTFIYMAFAEQPLVGDNPATAR
jgi:hypothetical protein